MHISGLLELGNESPPLEGGNAAWTVTSDVETES